MDPYEGEVSSGAIEYEPVSVKDVLVEMKDTAELLIDLSFSAVLHQSEPIAREVLRLEEQMDRLEMRGQMSLMLAARNPSEVEALAPVMGILTAADLISDASGDIAKIVLEDIGLPEALRAGLPAAMETLVRATVEPDSAYAGQTLVDIDLESQTGVRVIAIRRGTDWVLNPGPETTLESGDVTLLRGHETGIESVVETLSGQAYTPPPRPELIDEDLERAVNTIVHMKDLSELAVDLAYSSVLFDNAELAEEVRQLEVEVDALKSRFQAWTLTAAADAEDPVLLRGMLHLAASTEMISDAAVDIAEGVLRDIDTHQVVQLAVQESDEIITRIVVEPGSALEGVSIEGGVPATDVTMTALAIRRPESGWILLGQTDDTVRGGDILVAKGTRTSAAELEALTTAD
ncbi:MAG: TrkA C-terminal domain-containing protein [Natrialbaceae archaeon]|nr:TrkA C-terminal domain-containing protein [Natrialbaceae archaeon]